MNPASHRYRIALVALAALAFVATSCGSSGGSDASTTTTAKASTTTQAKTTTTAVNDDRPTKADLEAILPTAADIGAGWTLDTSTDDSSSAQDKAMDAQCPALKDLGTTNDVADKNKVKHSFTNAAGEQIEVSLSNDADKVDQAELAKKIEAVNSCGPITSTSDGVNTTIVLQAKANDAYGDFGVQMQAKVTLESEQLPQPVELNLYGLMFRSGTVGVSITGFDGLDQTTLKVTPVDTDALVAQAEAMQSAVKNLGGG